MNVQDYRAAGYALSSMIDQTAIDRAEADIKQCYLSPLGVIDYTNKDVCDALGNLAYLLVLQRSIVATRAGAKEKQTAQSTTAARMDILLQQSAICAAKVQIVADAHGVDKPWRVCNDLCGIYYSKQVLGY